MAFQGYASIKGTKQGQIKGQPIPHKGKGTASSIPLIAFEFGVQSPFDASGSATGKRQHKPVLLTVATGTAAAQLFQAYCNKELLSEVVIEPHQETVVPRVSLTSASTSQFRQYGSSLTPSFGGQGSSQSPSTGGGKPETVVLRVSLTSASTSQFRQYGSSLTPSFGGQGSGKSSSTANGKPETVAPTITLTNAVINKYISANSARGSSNGQGLISIELTYGGISYDPPRG